MPEVTYGGKDGEKLELEVDPNLVAVRTHSRRSLREGPVRRPESALLEGHGVGPELPRSRGRGL